MNSQKVQGEKLVTFRQEGQRAYLRFNRPERHNALVPELLADLQAALTQVQQTEGLVAVVLEAEGRSFSTGGDLGRFYEELGQIEAYAQGLVGQLNETILAVYDLPIPVIGKIQGPVTGGSLGLLLACDLLVMSEDSFLAPYYVEVGFAPDGGWAALLPARIGESAAREIQLLNRHISAQEAQELGLVTTVVPGKDLTKQVETWLIQLEGKVALGLTAVKKALLPPGRRAEIAAGLARERELFVSQVGRPEVAEGLRRFLKRTTPKASTKD